MELAITVNYWRYYEDESANNELLKEETQKEVYKNQTISKELDVNQ